MVAINARSELVHSRFIRVSEVTFFSATEPPAIEPAPDDRLRVVQEIDRIDNLAFLYYGDVRLQWALKWLNGIYLIPNDMVPGDELRIPSFTRLEQQGFVVR